MGQQVDNNQIVQRQPDESDSADTWKPVDDSIQMGYDRCSGWVDGLSRRRLIVLLSLIDWTFYYTLETHTPVTSIQVDSKTDSRDDSQQ